jgi:uncharacterized protein with GYD domain
VNVTLGHVHRLPLAMNRLTSCHTRPRQGTMPTVRFVLLFRNDPLAASAMLAGGSAGADFVEKTIREFGGSVEGAVAVTGRWDAVVSDFPSHEAVLAFSLSASASGQYVEVLPAVSREGLDTAREIASRVARGQSPAAEAGDTGQAT